MNLFVKGDAFTEMFYRNIWAKVTPEFFKASA